MRLEQFPILLGVFVALVGLGFVVDAWVPERFSFKRERRRRVRAARDRTGQSLVGLGTLAMAASLIGRDTWRFGTLAVIVGFVLVLLGAWLNRAYLHEMLTFRGPARRAEPGDQPERPEARPAPPPAGDAPRVERAVTVPVHREEARPAAAAPAPPGSAGAPEPTRE